ncbi:HD-GYP domain-containing protein [Chitinilyticum aquatile]|uniref:HD-GYP domain-containing protein n=1 Tax=Chitinilyticum aquatile TaxID=362520 RepID=UPI0006880D25|nr:two-component system response regulator [Chitinilyticum aquatile]
MNDPICNTANGSGTATILLVDDTPENLIILGTLLQEEGFQVRAATSGVLALEYAHQPPLPDLVLLDVMMPEMDGYAVLQKLRSNPATCDIPVILVTALSELSAELRGLAEGAVDYVLKPVIPPLVLARVRTQLELKQARDLLKDQNAWLEAEVRRRMHDNDLTQLVAIRALAHLAETRDPETGYHILRTQSYVQLLARLLQEHPRFAAQLNDGYIDLLTRSAPLHDIGKVGIPDAILRKPGSHTAEEWKIMQTHAQLGEEAIIMAERDVELPVPFLGLAKEIARSHHEKWNGSGYPDKLAGDAIPLSARLMALADVFDALISRRVYKPALSYDEARSIITAGRGSHFDPDIADAFLANFADFVAIAEQYREE